MDKEKIGRLIADCRKNINITQERLSEMLGVTAKSVSKWENGACLPDASLYEPLCNILGITINELFAGEKSENKDGLRAADKNLLSMLKHKMYEMSDKSISFVEFDNALTQISAINLELKKFDSKERAVAFLVKETGFSAEECARAYDFYIRLFNAEENI